MRKAYENNLNPYEGEDHYVSEPRLVTVATRKLMLPDVRDREIFHELDLEDLLGGRKTGVYRIVLLDPETHSCLATCRAAVTDLAVQTVLNAVQRTMVVFVRSLGSGKPVPGADLTVFSRKNCTVAAGKTGADGSALLKFDPAWGGDPEDYVFAVTAKKDDDFAYLSFCADSINSYDCSNFSRSISANDFTLEDLSFPLAFVFPERGAARPGETITAGVFLRQKKANTWVPLKNTPVTLRLVNPQGTAIASSSGTTDEYGFARKDFRIPENGATGIYRIVCYVTGPDIISGSACLQVASYVPDRFRITGSVHTRESKLVSQPVDFEFAAKYYFGAPVDSGTCRCTFLTETDSNPKHWDKSWSVGSVRDFKAAQAPAAESALSGKPLRFTYPGFTVLGGRAFNPVRITACSSFTIPGGQTVSGTESVTLYPTDFFIGVREGKELPGGEKSFEFTLLPAEKCDEFLLDRPFAVTFRFTRCEWDYVFVRENGRFQRKWEQRRTPVPDRDTVVTVPAGKFKTGSILNFKVRLPAGNYQIEAVSGDSHLTKMNFLHDTGSDSLRTGNPNLLCFKLNAETYKPGDTVKFSFDAPGSGEIFMVGGERNIDWHRSVPVKTGKNELTFTLPADIHSSSYFVGCTLAAKNGSDWIRNFNVLTVPVDQTAAHRLAVGISAPETAKPDTEIPVTVTLKDAAGKPQSGLAVLYAVDSGVISLTRYTAPDIFRFFYGPGNCSFMFFDMYGMLYRDLKINPDGSVGGDADMAKLGSIKQKHTARVIAPKIVIPPSGTATVKVRLPDHIGSLDFFAVASSENAAGSAKTEVITRLPVTVTLSAPRYLAPGDTAEISLSVFNHQPGEADYTCTVTLPENLEPVDGAGLVFTGKGLKEGTSQTLKLSVRAKEILGSGSVGVSLKSGENAAGDSAFVTVRSISVSRTDSRLACLKPGETFQADFSGDYLGKTSGFVRVSASPAFSLTGALDWLNRYPYGCLEQTAAAAFPFLCVKSLAEIGIIDRKMADAAIPKIADAYANLQAMALWNGAFSMWPNGRTVWNEGSVFALNFIFEAERIGVLKIDPYARKQHLDWLSAVANQAGERRRALRAHAVYVLATAGDSRYLVPAENILKGTEKPDFALMLTAGALFRGGCANLAVKPFKDAVAAECWRNGNDFPVISSEVSRLGMLLYIMMDSGVEDDAAAAKLAMRLASGIRPDGSAWGTTQANAWAALGLAAYALKHPPVPASAAITANGTTEKAVIEKSKTAVSKDGGPVSVTNTSRGEIIVESRITGIPKKVPEAGGLLKISREYLNAEGKPVTEVKHGDLISVRIRFEADLAVSSLVIADLLPAGLEIEDDMLATRAVMIPDAPVSKYGALCPVRLEKRDDRFLFFGSSIKGRGEIVYRVRAVSRGSFIIPPVHAESMYNPDVFGTSGSMGRLTVK